MIQLPKTLLNLIQQGKGVSIEHIEASTDILESTLRTVCSFSNREGGHIFLGVKDNGEITGVDKDSVQMLTKEFVATLNNGNKINPPLYIDPIVYEYERKIVIYLKVPRSPNVVQCAGKLFDRNGDSDLDITHNQSLVFKLYSRKLGISFVAKVFPAFSIKDLRPDLIDRARTMARVKIADHPWERMSDEELLRSANLIAIDPDSGSEGLTLAAILLFGSDSLIGSVLPYHKTDAIYRVHSMDRYDDRDVVITNLLDSYDRLIRFGQKHLNDTFVLDGLQNVSARDKILREIVSNSLVHRDYSSNFIAKLIIERDQIVTENSSISGKSGNLDIRHFEPVTKNPLLSKMFREIGLAEELGSGMRNTYKYTKLYSGEEPTFAEGDIFKTTIPLSETTFPIYVAEKHSTSIDQGSLQARILELLKADGELTQVEIADSLEEQIFRIKDTMANMVKHNLIERVGGRRYGFWKVLIKP